MTEFSVDFEILQQKELDVEFEMEQRQELDPTFQLNVTKEGKDATINGVNTLTITASNGITLEQDGEVATISGSELKQDISNEGTARQLEDENLQEQITAVSVLANGYIHEQGIASSVWEIQHNLNKYPSVSVVDSAENEIVVEVKYIDKNNVKITMKGASKGRAYLN